MTAPPSPWTRRPRSRARRAISSDRVAVGIPEHQAHRVQLIGAAIGILVAVEVLWLVLAAVLTVHQASPSVSRTGSGS